MRGWFAALGLVVLAFSLTGEAAERPDDLFESKIRPVLAESCFSCHGAKKVSGGLRVDSLEALLKGGDSGPAIVPGDPGASLLLKAMRHEKGVEPMPPKKPMDRPAADAFAAWIKAGAKWPKGTAAFVGERHWAFEPLGKVFAPGIAPTPVDAFLDRTLRQKGWKPNGPAEPRTLIRRATFDLTGMPPTPGEVETFLADRSPDAFAKVVDRLLASPRYGERWGRHWLDVVRYADSAGENSDHPLPHAWRYRNWVIGAFDQDKPYDEFIREQIAGDLLAKQGPPEKADDRIVATGYLAIARRFGHEIDKDIHLTIEDALDTIGKSVLGLSIGCARCHTHKYDPITAEDYYALYGILASTKLSFPGCEPAQQPRDLIPLAPTEYDRVAKPLREKIAALDKRLMQMRPEPKRPTVAPGVMLARGAFDDGKGQSFATTKEVEVKKGEMLQLSVSPGRDHGADSTLVEFDIREVGEKGQRWNLTRDVLDDFPASNPHGVWCFLDARKGATLLPEAIRNHSGKPGLHVWRDGDTPSVFVNASKEPITVWTKLPARSVFMHPARDGAVAIGWRPLAARSPEIRHRNRIARDGRPHKANPRLDPGTGRARRPLARSAIGLRRDGGHHQGRPAPPTRRPGEARQGGAETMALALRGQGRPAEGREWEGGTGRVVDAPRQPADGPRDGQSGLAAPLRQGSGQDAERLRDARHPADAPRVARLARCGLRARGLEHQAPAPADHAVPGVSTGQRRVERQ